MLGSKASILVVDDEPGVRTALSGVLRDEGYEVEAVESGEQCLDRVIRDIVDVIVLDVWLPGLDGLATLARLRQMKVDSQVVVISGHGNVESAVKAIKIRYMMKIVAMPRVSARMPAPHADRPNPTAPQIRSLPYSSDDSPRISNTALSARGIMGAPAMA